MEEHDNVRDVLKYLFEITAATSITTDGKDLNFQEVQELFAEPLHNLADLLGMEDLYLKKEGED